ncbi:hypothetical protein [Polaromonas sp.]|uniref:hypothetical protein n=1 Tax=Polaromonas sp. TaxID=1869339 RepID=UPI003267C896
MTAAPNPSQDKLDQELADLDAYGRAGPWIIPQCAADLAIARWGRLPVGYVVQAAIGMVGEAVPSQPEAPAPRGAQWKQEYNRHRRHW